MVDFPVSLKQAIVSGWFRCTTVCPLFAIAQTAARAATAPSGKDTTVASSSPASDVQTAELDASSDDSESSDEVPDDGLTDNQVRDLV